MIYFSADFHFGHANIIKYCKRPFLSASDQVLLDSGVVAYNDKDWHPDKDSVSLMDNTILDNINTIVKEEDELWFLGDFCFASSRHTYYETAKKYRNRINCKNIYILLGNHDKLAISPLFSSVNTLTNITYNSRIIVMCHYAMRTWYDQGRSYMLYGHSHGNLPDDPNALSIDVGVDCHDFKPLSFYDVEKIMAKKVLK